MTQCTHIDAGLNREASPLERARFARHLSGCPECRRRLAGWQQVRAVLAEEVDAANIPPSPEKVQRLIARASAGKAVSADGHRKGSITPYLAAAATLLVLGSTFLFMRHPSTTQTREAPVAARPTAGSALPDRPRSVVPPQPDKRATSPGVQPGPWLEEDAHISLGDHVVRVRAGARARVERDDEQGTDIFLERGSLSFSVAPRRDKREFAIRAFPYRIRVVGTVFEVDYTRGKKLDVLVADGMVEVKAPTELPVRVAAGQRLKIDRDRYVALEEGDKSATKRLLLAHTRSPELHTKPVKPAPHPKRRLKKEKEPPTEVEPESTTPTPLLSTLRRMVLHRRFGEAEQGLVQYLETRPTHAGAWSLLGDCRRKQGQWEEAITAYRNVIKQGDPSQANRARYLAGVLAQDHLNDHTQAETLFEAYLAHSFGASLVDAKIRLAHSKVVLAKRAEARELLTGVIRQSQDDDAREWAQKLLDSIR